MECEDWTNKSYKKAEWCRQTYCLGKVPPPHLFWQEAMFVRWRRRPAYQSDFAQKLDLSGISCNALTLPWTKTDLRLSLFANKYIVWARYFFHIVSISIFMMQNQIFELGQKIESGEILPNLPFPWMPFILHLKTKALHQLFHSLPKRPRIGMPINWAQNYVSSREIGSK